MYKKRGKRMKQRVLSSLIAALVSAAACLGGCMANADYQSIDAQTAKQMMDAQPDAVVLDVREPDEYAQGHIPGAVLLCVGQIDAQTAQAAIGRKDATVLVYCRSGNRSKTAASRLAQLGYENVYEFGGSLQWPYEIVR